MHCMSHLLHLGTILQRAARDNTIRPSCHGKEPSFRPGADGVHSWSAFEAESVGSLAVDMLRYVKTVVTSNAITKQGAS